MMMSKQAGNRVFLFEAVDNQKCFFRLHSFREPERMYYYTHRLSASAVYWYFYLSNIIYLLLLEVHILVLSPPVLSKRIYTVFRTTLFENLRAEPSPKRNPIINVPKNPE